MTAAGNIKVVLINTQYVETDAMSFKSVVQKLTGKDSTVMVEKSAYAALKRPSKQSSGTSCDSGRTPPVLLRGMSFRDFEMMLKELPPLEELYRQIC